MAPAIAQMENETGDEKVRAEKTQFDLVEGHARARRGYETKRVHGREDMHEQQGERWGVDRRKLRERLLRRFRPFRENQRKMQQQRGGQQTSDHTRPVHFEVEGVQFSTVLEGVENERDQAEDIEVNRARGVPSADENEQPDEQVKEPNHAEIVFNGDGFVGRSGDQPGLKLYSAAGEFVAQLGPKPGAKQPARHV